MVRFCRHAVRWVAFVQLALALSACASLGSPKAAATHSPTIVSRTSLWTNTFPPIKYNGSTLRFQHYGLEEGLSQSSVQAILQDAQGYLWLGTQDGLNRFDGYSFTVYRPDTADPYSLSSGEILALAEGLDGSLWIGTNAGLNRYDPLTKRFTRWVHEDRKPESLADDTVQALFQDPQGPLWVGTQAGLQQFDPATGTFTRFNMLDRPAGSTKVDSITSLYEDNQRVLWIGTRNGLVRYGLEDHRFERYQNESGETKGISFNEVSAVAQEPSGVLWIGTHAGLDRFDPKTGAFTPFVHSDQDPRSLADNYIESLLMDRAGQLWVGTRSGLDRFDRAGQDFIHYQSDSTDPSSLSSNTVASIYEDRGGNLWVGTANGGLNLQDRSQDRFAFYHHVNSDPASLSGDVVFPIVPAADGRMWIGTYDGGLNLFDPASGRSQSFRHDPANPTSLLNDSVISLYLDNKQVLWVGTHEGLDRLLPASTHFTHYVYHPLDPGGIPFGPVYKIYQDSGGTYYISTSHGLRTFDPATGRFSEMDIPGAAGQLLNNSAVMAIYQDRTGRLWFGTDSHGLVRYDPATQETRHYTAIPGSTGSLSSNAILDLREDSRGILWIATLGGGLDRYVPEKDGFIAYRQGEGLPNDVVYGTLEDNAGFIWFSTNRGISRLDVANGTFENFTVEDGLQSNEFDSSSFARDASGRLYFGGIRGLTVFDPADIQDNAYVPPLVLTSMAAQDGKALDPQRASAGLDEVTITYPQNSFDFSFAALSFSQVGRNQYKYMLDGFDRDWHTIGSDHRGSYTNLPGGTYTLRVIGSNSDGVWNTVGTALRVTVVPPFWQTWLFRSLAGIGLVAAAALLYRTRVQRIEAQKTALEHVVMDRTQTLKKQNLDLQALYSADEKMLRVLTQDEILRALVDVAVDTLQADKIAIFLPAAPSDQYRVWVSRGFQQETVESEEFCASQQRILRKAAGGFPVVIADTENDSNWAKLANGAREVMASEGVRSLLYIPIRVQDTVIGVFSACSSAPGVFDEDRQRLFASLVRRAALSLENSELFERTRQIAVLEERNRMAQELHDSAKQKAFAALAQLGAAKKLANQDHGRSAEHLDEAESLVSEVIHDLTFFIHEAYPDSLMETGLAVALREDALAWQNRSGIRLNVSISNERRLSPSTEEALYRIVQEGLSNIARHSGATQANIDLVYEERDIFMEIADNGRGFDQSRMAEGLGLRLIRERLERLGGEIDILSGNGHGTLLSIRAPI